MANPVSPSTSALSSAALRIVLFGMPDAGKSSLLGALAEAAQTQEHLLSGHLTDVSHGLAELQHRLYDGTPRETVEEVVPYVVSFVPFVGPARRVSGSTQRSDSREAVLVDCDGRVANELLTRRRSLDEQDGGGSLARAILQADTLILAVDASAPPAQIDSDFVEFGRFLRLLEVNRGRRSDIGGLPVFLVLTKCDLLAQPTETAAAWLDQIEERKREVGRRFEAFLAQQRNEKMVPFGRVDLHLWATAVKHPPLTDSPAQPRAPFGVAELFRQSLQSAAEFRTRRQRSGRRLLWTAGGTTGFVALMVGLGAVLWTHRGETRESVLRGQVAIYRSTEGQTPSARLREPLQRKLSAVKELKNSAEFAALPADEQAYVEGRLQELQDYQAYWERLAHVKVSDLHSTADLERLDARLTSGDLAMPASYESAWKETDAGLLRGRLLKDVEALRQAVAEATDWYRHQIRHGEELRTFAKDKPADAASWAEWDKQAGALVAQPFPHAEREDLLGSTELTWAAVLPFEGVAEARRDGEAVRVRLERLHDLIAALGLAGPRADGVRQPLDIPEHLPPGQARAFVQRLEQLYPRLLKEVGAIELPDAVAAEVRRAARNRYDHLIEAGREVVLAHLQQASPSGQETPDSWRRLRDWLATPDDLRDWRVLATLLARVQDADAPDPVPVLAEFVHQDQFTMDLQRLTLELPFDLKVRPAGLFTVYHGVAGSESSPAFVFRIVDEEGRRDAQRRVTSYALVREKGAALTYHSGDHLYADLPVRHEGSTTAWMLTWARSRSDVYQFERLVRPPRLHRRDQDNTQGELTEDVRLGIAPDRGVPRVPDLVPVVQLTKR